MTSPDQPVYVTSSYSGDNGECVEVARSVSGDAHVRDSKNRLGGELTFDHAGWAALLDVTRQQS